LYEILFPSSFWQALSPLRSYLRESCQTILHLHPQQLATFLKKKKKTRARDRQREVVGDKGQWGFVLQGMRPAVAQAVEWWQGVVLIIPPTFCLILMRVGAEDQELG
jgi:hypothetical protein